MSLLKKLAFASAASAMVGMIAKFANDNKSAKTKKPASDKPASSEKPAAKPAAASKTTKSKSRKIAKRTSRK
ncbi:MAG: hypothetical protein H0V17_34750 [Deltaproteobacteria bacterium]|nr:hypothetical protein [Deltaproteobacteria bacterium]